MPRGKRKTVDEDGRMGKKSKSGLYSGRGYGAASSAATDNGSTDDKPKEERMKIRLEGSKTSGDLLFCGGTNWDLIGRASLPKTTAGVKPQGGRNLWGPHHITSIDDIRIRSVISGPTACHSIIITEDGKAMSWGRNDREQLGHGDNIRRDNPTLIESLKEHNIVSAACGRNHTLCLTEYGTVFAFGDNRYGQLGIGLQSASVGNPVKVGHKGQPIVKVACGADFSMILDCKGSLHSFGHPEYSQLGHNNDGQYFVTSNKLSFDCQLVPRKVQMFVEKTKGHVMPVPNVLLTDVACGTNHVIALDIRKRVFTWGFGGYGRLGHAEPKDEKVPRNLKTFDVPGRGASSIYCGASFSMAVSEQGVLYFWGQTKTTGEATMYPKPVQDLTGWKIRSVGCSNHSIVIAADESIISWGPSPTYGELGYGDHGAKSSTQPKEIKLLDGIFIHSLSCGYGHTLMIARNDSDEDRDNINKLPEFSVKPEN